MKKQILMLEDFDLTAVDQFQQDHLYKTYLENIKKLGAKHSVDIQSVDDTWNLINVMQKGYVLNGRLIRPAMVVVAQAVI